MIVALAKRYGAMIGGSYLSKRGEDVFNSYVLVDRDGNVQIHDKDLPTMVENAYYKGGSDDGLVATAHGDVGIAVCWETIRTATVTRLSGKVDLLMTGSHWWSEPGWAFPRWLYNHIHSQNLAMMGAAPSRLARMIGAPVLHAAHVGTLNGRFALAPGVNVRTATRLMGETQIVDGRGQIQSRMGIDDGAGLVMADIEIGRVGPSLEPAQAFWSLDLPMLFRLFWAQQNSVSRPLYAKAKREGRLTTFDFTRNSQGGHHEEHL